MPCVRLLFRADPISHSISSVQYQEMSKPGLGRCDSRAGLGKRQQTSRRQRCRNRTNESTSSIENRLATRNKMLTRTLRLCPTRLTAQARALSIRSEANKFYKISEEVQDAIATGKPVVALETAIYTHGSPRATPIRVGCC